MRVSILVNSVDPTACHDYAVLWLDPVQRVWTRQTSVGIALPPEGAIVDRDDATLVTDPNAHADTLLTLGNFRLDARQQLASIVGKAAWFSLTRHTYVDGLWRLQAIERASERAPDTPRQRRAANRGSMPPGRGDGVSGPCACR